MAKTDRPWALGTIHHPPSGLREAVLRVAYLSPSDAADIHSHGILQTAVDWRLGIGCTGEQWDELVSVVRRMTRRRK